MKGKPETSDLAFLVRDLEEAKAIIRELGELEHSRPLLLISAPSTAAKEGALWFRSLIEEAGRQKKHSNAVGIVDCGAHAGYALEALELAPLGIIFSGSECVAEKLSTIAAAKASPFFRERPEVLELPRDPKARVERLQLLVKTLALK